MLKLYDYLETRLDEHNKFHHIFFDSKLDYFVSEIMEMLVINDPDEIASSVNRAFRVCEALQLSQGRNFKRVYRYDGENMKPDWKISSLACYLIVINSNPSNEHVAKAQLYFAMKIKIF